MAFKSMRKEITLIVVILSFASLLLHLIVAKFSTVDRMWDNSVAELQDDFASISRTQMGMGPFVVYAKDYVSKDLFHDKRIFKENYNEMKRGFKICVYPHRQDDPFANVLLPVGSKPGGNYASESYFKKALWKSRFIMEDPNEANLSYLTFSISRLRYDSRVGVGGMQEFVQDYVLNVSQKYPYWNWTAGADHFYVACHSTGRSAMEKASQVKLNAIQIVCSSSYFLRGYISPKDACLPQIWPREGDPPNFLSTNK